MKLFRVWLKGMTSSATGTVYGCPYVVARSPDDAYDKVRKFLDEENLGFSSDRALEKIEVLAEEGRYSELGIQLFL